MRIAVWGAGSWGTALAVLLARNSQDVTLFGRAEDDVDGLRHNRENSRYLPGFAIPESVRFGLIGEPAPAVDLHVIAVPSSGVREVARTIPTNSKLLLIASKGLEPGTGRTLAEVVSEHQPAAEIAVLSGPNLAIEVVRGIPSVAELACRSSALAEAARSALESGAFRVYCVSDVKGVSLAGALKNVLAIGAGISDGLGFGDNTKAALLARGLAEMCQLGEALGAKRETFYGVAGVGDLVATANSKLSRNYRVGYEIGLGHGVHAAIASVDQVAEGIPTSEGVSMLARNAGLELPIFEATEAVLRGHMQPRAAVTLLMERTLGKPASATGQGMKSEQQC